MTTRLSIDQLRSARVRRETYVGQWLPEPLLTDRTAPDPADTAQQADSVSMAFLLVLERLGPVERAVFLLHDVFDYGYGDIADDRREVAGQLPAARGSGHGAGSSRTDHGSRRPVNGGMSWPDGSWRRCWTAISTRWSPLGSRRRGGRRQRRREPVVAPADPGRGEGVPAVAGAGRTDPRSRHHGATAPRSTVSLAPCSATRGQLINVFSLDIADGAVRTVRSVINPEKLAHLGPLADLAELQRRRHPRRD